MLKDMLTCDNKILPTTFSDKNISNKVHALEKGFILAIYKLSPLIS